MTPAERRVKFRVGLNPTYIKKYDLLCEFLQSHWAPISGIRTFDEQTALYAQGRVLGGRIVTHAQAGESPHNYGCATDWVPFIGTTPIWPEAGDPQWNPYVIACLKAGLHWGGDFKKGFQDRPHNELLIGCGWHTILQAYQQGGMDAAQALIQAQMR